MGPNKLLQEQDAHAKTYRDYENSIRSGLWYGEVRALHPDSREGHDALQLDNIPLTVDATFWQPDESIIEHVVTTAIQMAGKDNKKSPLLQAKTPRTDWHTMPINWAERHGWFRDRLVEDTVRLTHFGLDSIDIRRATYLDQVGTNLNSHVKFKAAHKSQKPNLREADMAGGSFKPLKNSLLSNTIGVGTMFFGNDDLPVIVKRGLLKKGDKTKSLLTSLWPFQKKTGERQDGPIETLGPMPEGWHWTSSGVMNWQDVEAAGRTGQDSTWFRRAIAHAMQREIMNELVLGPLDYALYPIYFAREVQRAGKPQFFFAARTPKYSALELAQLIANRYSQAVEQEIDITVRSTGQWPPGFLEVTGEFSIAKRRNTRSVLFPSEKMKDLSLTYEGAAGLELAREAYRAGRLWSGGKK